MQDGLFRKAAIDKMSSPEQLDLMMQVTSPIGWLALVTVGALLAGVIVWSIVGSIPDLVDGQGALFRGERLSDVQASMQGRISRLEVSTGAEIQAGQLVAIIRLDAASLEDRTSNETNIARNEAMIDAKRGQIGSLRMQLAKQQELVREGLKPENVLFEYQSRIIGVEGELNSLLKETAVLKSRMQSTAEVKATESGRVVEVLKANGDQVRAGEPLLRIEPSTAAVAGVVQRRQFCGGNVHTILYVPARMAGKLRPGQAARISPLDVKKEEFGYMLGKVEWVASFAASTDDMREKLKNDQLVNAFAQQGPVFEARVCLEPDPTNKANGFRWSSSTGPEKPIESGSACSASVVVDQRKPYTYVIPTIRRMVGI